jgi:hypothetical protein
MLRKGQTDKRDQLRVFGPHDKRKSKMKSKIRKMIKSKSRSMTPCAAAARRAAAASWYTKAAIEK